MKMILRQEKVQCGKKCEECPHGPYWYGYLRPGTRLRKVYFGVQHPSENAVRIKTRQLVAEADAWMKKKLMAKKRTQEYSRVKSVHKRAVPPSPSIGRSASKLEQKSVVDKKSFGTRTAKKTR